MADYNPSVALDIQPAKAPDIIGNISSLAQLQYLAGQAQVAKANAAFLGGKVQSLQDYGRAVAGGADPADALSSSNLAAYDPQGANAILGNIGTARGLKANASYATSGDPRSLGILGPEAVQKGMTTQANQNFASTGDPNSLRAAGADAYSTAMTAIKTGGETAIQRTNLMGQIGNGVVAGANADGTIPPEIRQSALQQAVKAGLITPQQAQQEASLSDGQFLNIAKSWTAAGQAAKDYAETSGQAQAAKSAAEANYKPLVTEPQQGVTLPPGLANVMYPGRAGATPAGPAPSALPAMPGPQSALPIMAQGGAPTGLPSAVNPAAPAPAKPAIPNPSNGPNAAPIQPLAYAGAEPNAAANPSAAAPNANGPNYYGAVSSHESGNNPNAVNKNGGASGLYQFMPDTWRTLMQQHPDLGLTANGATDPTQATKAMQAFTADNAKALASSGIAVNDKNLFMAHFLGAGGAAKFIQAGAQNPNANAAAMFPKEAAANPTIFYYGGKPSTLGEVYSLMTRNFGNGLTANGAPPSQGVGMAQNVPFAQPGGTPPLNAGQDANPALDQAAAIPIPANLRGSSQPAIAPPAASPSALPTPSVTPANPAAPASTPATPPPTSPLLTAATSPASPQNVPATGPVTLQPGMTLAQKAAQEETGRGMAAAQVKQFADAKEGYQTASTAQMNVQDLMKSLDKLPTGSSLLTVGPGAAERLGFAKAVNTALSAAGQNPYFPPEQIAQAELAGKLQGRLGFDLSRSLGAREAAQIVTQSIGLNPGMQNTPQGARMVGASIMAALQRSKDFYQFLSEKGNSPDADLQFNKAHPPSQYVNEVQTLASVPQKAIDYLEKNPKLAPQFDAKYGPEISRYFTGA